MIKVDFFDKIHYCCCINILKYLFKVAMEMQQEMTVCGWPRRCLAQRGSPLPATRIIRSRAIHHSPS